MAVSATEGTQAGEPSGDTTALVGRARRGDPDAFGLLFDLWFDRVYDVASRAAGDRALAAAITQDSFVQAWESLDRLNDPSLFGGNLRRIARDAALGTALGRAPTEPAQTPEAAVAVPELLKVKIADALAEAGVPMAGSAAARARLTASPTTGAAPAAAGGRVGAAALGREAAHRRRPRWRLAAGTWTAVVLLAVVGLASAAGDGGRGRLDTAATEASSEPGGAPRSTGQRPSKDDDAGDAGSDDGDTGDGSGAGTDGSVGQGAATAGSQRSGGSAPSPPATSRTAAEPAQPLPPADPSPSSPQPSPPTAPVTTAAPAVEVSFTLSQPTRRAWQMPSPEAPRLQWTVQGAATVTVDGPEVHATDPAGDLMVCPVEMTGPSCTPRAGTYRYVLTAFDARGSVVAERAVDLVVG